MVQAGIHSLVGLAVRKWTPVREWLMLGIVLGNMLPDADNLAVVVATVAGLPTEELHRTFTSVSFSSPLSSSPATWSPEPASAPVGAIWAWGWASTY